MNNKLKVGMTVTTIDGRAGVIEWISPYTGRIDVNIPPATIAVYEPEEVYLYKRKDNLVCG